MGHRGQTGSQKNRCGIIDKLRIVVGFFLCRIVVGWHFSLVAFSLVAFYLPGNPGMPGMLAAAPHSMKGLTFKSKRKLKQKHK